MKKELVEREVVTTKIVQEPTYTISFTEEQAAALMYLLGKMRGDAFNTVDGVCIFSWLKGNLPPKILDIVKKSTDSYWAGEQASLIKGVSSIVDEMRQINL